MDGNYLKQVRDQYEDYPYPQRDPKDEKKRLMVTSLDGLHFINHVVYGGKQTFRNGFKVLVAGGGTGDAAIYLAEQLRHMPQAQVYYVDLSTASMEIAQQRAKVRRLKNISWHHLSLLDVAELGVMFDYINCSGVLHHLEDPEEGLRALESVLAPDGAMGLMIYAQYGRTSIYQMQELMRLITGDDMPAAEKVAMTKEVMALLPATNLFHQQAHFWQSELTQNGDIGIYDLLLHSTDRAYTIPETYAWLASAKLNLLRFAGGLGDRLNTMPEFIFGRDPEVLAHIKTLPEPQQQGIAELAHGKIYRQIFWASRQLLPVADVQDEDMIPTLCQEYLGTVNLAKSAQEAKGQAVAVTLPKNVTITLPAGKYIAAILANLDGQKTIGNLLDTVVKAHDQANIADVRAEFMTLYRQLEMIDALVLRHKSVPAFVSIQSLNASV